MTVALVAASTGEGSAFVGGLLFFGGIAVVAVSLVRDRPRHPNLPCRRCGGSGVRRSQWNSAATGPCRKCGGFGRRRRLGSGVQ